MYRVVEERKICPFIFASLGNDDMVVFAIFVKKAY